MRRVLNVLTWDGILPVIVGLAPIAVRGLFPRGHLAEVIVLILLPISLALVRSQTGYRELMNVTGGKVSTWRQVLFGTAIALLLGFEFMMMMLIFAKDEPDSAWIAPAVLLAIYLAAIWFALCPSTRERAVFHS